MLNEKLPNNLRYRQMLYCYQTILNFNKKFYIHTPPMLLMNLGYLEACLQSCGAYKDNNGEMDIKTLKNKTWYRKELKETRTEALIRMCKSYFESIGLDYNIDLQY